MQKGFFVIFFLLFTIYISYGQHPIYKPDYKKIEKTIKKNKSAQYYPTLLERYQKNDTTLTDEDYTFLYYGSLLQAGYSPYQESLYSDSTGKIFEKKQLALADYDLAIQYENICLKETPFSLRDLNILAYSYSKTGNDSLAILINTKKEKIIKIILSTGDGKSDDTGFHVIAINQEYDLLQILGFEFSGQQTLTKKGCDYLTVKENKYGLKGIYFDVNKILEIEYKLLK